MRFERIAWTLAAALVSLSGSSCVTLDSFVFNPIHCSTVSSATCEEKEERSRACTPCDEAYDVGKEYGFFEGVFEDPTQPRPIADEFIEQQTFSTSDGVAELDLYFIRSHGEDPSLANTTILYNHGNYAGIETYLARIRALHEMGFNILVWDYRGYGKSMPETTPSPTEFLSDALEIRALANTLAPDPDKIVIYGFSLGAIPSTEVPG